MGPLVGLLLLLAACAGSRAEESTTTVETTTVPMSGDPLRSCALYCFITPKRTERVDFSLYSNLSCTHFVYGIGEITGDMQYKGPSLEDEATHSYPGNFHFLKKLKRRHPNAKILLGAHLNEHADSFIPYPPSRAKLVSSLLLAAHDLHTDGLFLRIDRPFIDNSRFVHFFQELTSSNDSLPVVMGIPVTLLLNSLPHILDAQEYISTFYLMSTPELNRLAQIDPLLATKATPPEQTISYHAQTLTDKGVAKKKIVVGLTAGSVVYRNYLVDSVRGEAEGRLEGWQETCGSVGERVLDIATATEMVKSPDSWIASNAPTEGSIGRKVRWLTSMGYGGIGLQSLQHDDPKGECGLGAFPAVRIISGNMDCAKPEEFKSCTRFCYINSDHSLEKLAPTACSHIVAEATLTALGEVKLSTAGEATARWMRNWHVAAKPRLVISLGQRATSDVWRIALAVQYSRKIVIKQLQELITEWRATGVEVSWTLGGLDYPSDAANLEALLVEMREALGKVPLLALAASHTATYKQQFLGMKKLNTTVDHVVLHTHRFHSTRQPFTGHHSPLFFSSEILPDRRNTVENLVAEWIAHHHMPRSKVIVGITAEPLSMMLMGADRADQSPFNMNAFPSVIGPNMRAADIDEKRATDGRRVCELEKDLSSRVTFLTDIAVPFLVNGGQFVAYENERSVQMKTNWVSLNHLGGIALFDAQLDDPEGACAKEPFPLLNAIIRAQMCEKCIHVDGFEPCDSTFTTSCSYRLPTASEKNPMPADKIPLDSCTQVVIEEVMLRIDVKFGETEIVFHDETARKAMIKLASTQSPKMGNKRLIAAVRCDGNLVGFRKMLMHNGDQMGKLLLSFVSNYSLSGIELKCDHLVTPETGVNFSEMMVNLKTNLINSTPMHKCHHSLSVRLPIYTTDFSEKNYDVKAFNAVKHVVLEPFNDPPKRNTTHLNSPLFAANGHAYDVDTTIRAWAKAGLEKSKIIVQIPAYATLQDIGSNLTEIGSVAYNERVIDQAQVCSLLKKAQKKMLWDRIATYAITEGNKWMSMQDQETIAYKIFYAIREGLGGMGLLSLNEDDWAGKCGSGEFPMLTATKARCLAPYI